MHLNATEWIENREHNTQRLLELRDKYGTKKSALIGIEKKSREPLFADYSNQDRLILMAIAGQGSGKSVFNAWNNYYFSTVHQTPELVFDRSDEYQTHRQPLTSKPKAIETLKELGLKPDKLNADILRIRPKGVEGNCDKTLALSLSDIQEFGQEAYEYLMMSLLQAKADSPSQLRAIGYLCQQKGVKTLSNLQSSFKAHRQQMKEEGDSVSVGHLQTNFEMINNRNVLHQPANDNKNPNIITKETIYEYIQQRKTLLMLGAFDSMTQSSRILSFYANYLATALYNWRWENKIPPCLISREEASQMLSFPEGQATIAREINLERKAGNHYTYFLQDLYQLPQSIEKNLLTTPILTGTKMPEEYIEKIARAKMIDAQEFKNAIYTLQNKNRPYDWWLINNNREIQIYEPIPSPSQWWENH